MICVVLDASVAAGWIFSDLATPPTLKLRQSLARNTTACVPAVWREEIIHALLVAERSGRLLQKQADLYFQLLSSLPIEIEENPPRAAWGEVYCLSRQHQLSTAQSAYLELALRRGLPLASMDNGLREAGRRSGVRLVPT